MFLLASLVTCPTTHPLLDIPTSNLSFSQMGHFFLNTQAFYRRLFLLPGIASQPHVHNSLLFLQTLHIKCPWLLATIPIEFLFSCRGSFGLYLCTSVNSLIVL